MPLFLTLFGLEYIFKNPISSQQDEITSPGAQEDEVAQDDTAQLGTEEYSANVRAVYEAIDILSEIQLKGRVVGAAPVVLATKAFTVASQSVSFVTEPEVGRQNRSESRSKRSNAKGILMSAPGIATN